MVPLKAHLYPSPTGLFIECEETTDNIMVDFEQELEFYAKEDVDEEIILGGEGSLLVIR